MRDSGSGLFGKTSSSPVPISASLSVPPFFFSLWSFSHGYKIPRRGTSWLVLVDCLALIMCQLIIAVRVKTPGYRDKAFSALTIWVSSESVEAVSRKEMQGEKSVYLLFLLPYFPFCQLTAT